MTVCRLMFQVGRTPSAGGPLADSRGRFFAKERKSGMWASRADQGVCPTSNFGS